MKKILLVIVLLTYVGLNAQIKVDETSFKYYYQEIFEVEGSKEILKENANAWLVKNYKNTNQGIKMNSDNNLIGKGVFDGQFKDGIGGKKACEFHFTIEISFKENRYRLTINDIYPESEDAGLTYFPYFGSIAPIEDDETFRTIHAELIENYLGMGKKMNKKHMLNPKNTSKNRKRQTKAHDFISPQIKTKLLSISKELESYMKKSQKDDW